VSDVHAILIDDARQALLREIAPAVGRNDLHEAFAAWLCPGAVPGLGIEGAAGVAVRAVGAERHFAHVAVLGLTAQTRALGDEERAALVAGLNVTVNREPVVAGTPMGFCMDGVALASLILGAKAAGGDGLWSKACGWVHRCREVTASGMGLGVWQEWLLSAVCDHTGFGWARKGGGGSAEAAEVRVALRSRGIGAGVSASTIAKDEGEALGLIRTSSPTGLGVSRAAIRLAALDWIRRDRPVCDLRTVTAADIGELLRRVPAGLKNWTWEDKPRTKTSPAPRHWHVENEYHVQNMLWMLLAPLFPDLIDEDSTPKVGPVQPRADIVIPSLRLIVEAKFMRADDPPKKMVEQIAQDASLYLVPGSKYDKLIPFIWDDSRRTEHHEEMIRGLRQIAGVVDAVIVPRPGSMIPPSVSGAVSKPTTKKKKSATKK
jgi:REase_DpnII-MboI